MPERFNFEDTFKRELAFDARGICKDARTCEMALSSELPVSRGNYDEILIHDADSCDMSRISDGSHPLLLNHDPERQIGIVESARLCDDKKIRCVVRFSKSPLGEEIWGDVQDGIRRLVSVGYRRTKEVSTETIGGRELVRFAWQPYEASIVSIPADATVGIGRSETITESPKVKEKICMPEVIETKPENRSAKDILKIAKNLAGRVENAMDLAQTAIDQDWTVERFQHEALNRLPEAKPMEKPIAADVPTRDWDKYSITRAIQGQMNGRMDGFEGEMNQEFSKRFGAAQGLWLPPQAMARNFVAATGTLGGMLVETQNKGDQFIELLRNRTKVLQLGAKTLNLSGPVTIPRQSGAGTVNVVAESVAATLATGNFTQITLTPYGISAFQQYSKALLIQSNPSIDQLIRDDIMQQIAIEIDRLAIHGAGPTGIAGTSGIGAVAMGTNAAAFTSANAWPAIVSLETEVAIDNADVSTCAYLTNAKVRGKLKVVDKSAAANTAQWVWGADGTLNGYRAEVSNQVSSVLTKGTATTICSAIIFGNFADLIVAQFNGGATDLVVDPYVLAANGVVRILARHWVDIGIRHPESFAILPDILAG